MTLLHVLFGAAATGSRTSVGFHLDTTVLISHLLNGVGIALVWPGLPVHVCSMGYISMKMSRNRIQIQFPVESAEGLNAFSVTALPVTSLLIMKIQALNNPDYNPVHSNLLAKCFAMSLAIYIFFKGHACSSTRRHASQLKTSWPQQWETAKGPPEGW